MNRPWRSDRALRRSDHKTVATRFTIHLHRTVAFVGDTVKRDETISLPMLGAFGIFAMHPDAKHLDFEMSPGFDGDAVTRRLDRIGIGADIAKNRVIDPIDELSRAFSERLAPSQRTGENSDYRRPQPFRRVPPRIHVALLNDFPESLRLVHHEQTAPPRTVHP